MLSRGERGRLVAVVSMGGDGAEQPTRRRQLAAELRRARELLGMSGRELAHRIGVSQSKVSRIESGAAIPSVPEVTRWAEALGMSTERLTCLVALTESVFTEMHSGLTTLRNRTPVQDDIERRELRARLTRTFQPSFVPGLLQTAEYARRVIAMTRFPGAADELAETLAGRLRRQLVVYEEGRRFEFLITEAALRWRPGPPRLLIAQLDRIASLATLDNVSIGIIPADTETASPTAHGFVIYSANDNGQEPYAEVEMVHASLLVHEPADVGLYLRRWELLTETAVFDEDAGALLAKVCSSVRTAGER
jgi:transcriptional regulator with XRE-family HTH domain